MNKFLQKIDLSTPPSKVLQTITVARERKNKGNETLELINKAISTTHDYIVNLYFERAHIFQLNIMTERDKLEKGDYKKKVDALKMMEKYIKETEKYIVENKLDRWLSRLYRFYGKLYEYKRNYKNAVEYYKKSLKYWKTDPEVVEKNIPRNFELEGFLSSSIIMSGNSEKGLKMAKKVYGKYELTKEGRDLKRKDYTTWAIWRTGVVIYAARGLIEGRLKRDVKEINNWLSEAEKLLYPPKNVKTWADFQYRRDEISALKQLLKKV